MVCKAFLGEDRGHNMRAAAYCLFEEKTIAHMAAADDITAAAANETWRPIAPEYELGYVESMDPIQCPHCGGPLSFHTG